MLGQRTQARDPARMVADSALFEALGLCSRTACQRAGLPPVLPSTVSLPPVKDDTMV